MKFAIIYERLFNFIIYTIIMKIDYIKIGYEI